MHQHWLRGDRQLWTAFFILLGISLLGVYSATGNLALLQGGSPHKYFLRHFVLVASGALLAIAIARIPYTTFRRIATPLLILAIFLLMLTLVKGVKINEARRWLLIPFLNITFQTSAFAQFALILYLANTLSKMYDQFINPNTQPFWQLFKRIFLKIALPTGAIIVLIAPANLSTALLTTAIALTLMFVGLVPIRHLLLSGFILLFFGALIIGIAHIAGMETRLTTWQQRILMYFAPEDQIPYQVQQAQYALQHGGWFGQGPGKSLFRYYLPHVYSDYIFALIVEEYGVIGGVLTLALYLWILFRAIQHFLRIEGRFGALLLLGIGIALPTQALTHAGVVTGLLPPTGIPLPLISMGGTSIWFTCMLYGLLCNISAYALQPKPTMQQRPKTTPKPDQHHKTQQQPQYNQPEQNETTDNTQPQQDNEPPSHQEWHYGLPPASEILTPTPATPPDSNTSPSTPSSQSQEPEILTLYP